MVEIVTEAGVVRNEQGWIRAQQYYALHSEYEQAVVELAKTQAALAESKRNKVCKRGLIKQLQSEIQQLTIEKKALLRMLVDQENALREKVDE